MSIQTFWEQLNASQKAGFITGSLAIVALTAWIGYSTMKVDYIPVVTNANPERLAAAVREVEKLKVPYRVSDDGSTIEVPSNQMGRVRLGVASGANAGQSVGFEIFNSSDFSTTEFTQKVNYQRALQGELARTISNVQGVDAVRVHLVMPESGFLRRQSVSPTAAVNLTMQPGTVLTAVQVQGIQRLVAASIPEIKLKDIAVIDQTGQALTKTTSGADTNPSSDKLTLKREVDSYLESKLRKLLITLDPTGDFTVSVDASLNQDDVKTTTEDILPSGEKDGRMTGVLVRDRQSLRQDFSASADGASAPVPGSTTRDAEYRVGRRIEQVASTPGNIERVSVAVVARTSSLSADDPRIKDLIAHAIGVDVERGDSVAVVVLPAINEKISDGPALSAPSHAHAGPQAELVSGKKPVQVVLLAIVAMLALVGLGLSVLLKRGRQDRATAANAPPKEPNAQDIDEITARVKNWLEEGSPHAAA